MNNTYIKTLLIVLLMSFLNCKSQNVIILGQKNPNLPKNFKSSGQYYYKDVNNYLNSFIGTWEYVNGNEKFQIILTKITKYHEVISSPPYLNLNYYTDGISFKYKKFVNGNLIFESPNTNEPDFTRLQNNGTILEGFIRDFERVTKTVYKPQIIGGGVLKQGGEYFDPICRIEKQPLSLTEPPKIKFSLGFWENFGEYNNPIYNGLPTFSIPNDVVMTKVP